MGIFKKVGWIVALLIVVVALSLTAGCDTSKSGTVVGKYIYHTHGKTKSSDHRTFLLQDTKEQHRPVEVHVSKDTYAEFNVGDFYEE